MGNVKSKIKNGTQGKGKGVGQGAQVYESSQGRPDEYEDIELSRLRRAIKRDPERFVLNNLMMCVQFFRNYEEEIEHVKETLVSSREAELNKHLPPQKHILLPDVLQEHVARNVGFTSTRQTFRPTIEPLHPVRIYVVLDNIDISQQNYSPHYSSVNNAVTYNILLKPTEHQGYVQLQLLEEAAARKRVGREDEVDLSSIAENDDELYSDADSVYGPKPNSNLVLPGLSKQRTLAGLTHEYIRSMPDLSNSGILEQRNLSRSIPAYSAHNVKIESDCENTSSAEERRYRSKYNGEYRRHPKTVSRLKGDESTGPSRASSTSSGYRSGNYAMYSNSSFNTNRSCSSKSSKEEEIDDYSLANAELPTRCFKRVTYTTEGKIYDPREEKKQLMNSQQRRIKLGLRRHNYDIYYVSSTDFMKHFINLFVNRLSEPLGFDREAVDDAKREGCVLYCDKVMVSSTSRHSRVEQYEIMPAVWLEWPNCALEWLDRPRSTWPDYSDVGKIKEFGCYVVPEGYVPKKGSNIIQDLEWQLTFPAAERYLETCMTQAQVHIYLIALMLHKTFMRPIFDTMFGLRTAHIRNKLFWMIEENDRPSQWPDNRTGECLLSLLNSLYDSISQNDPTLRDYFVRDRNLFQRVPCNHLLHTQKQLKRITENPVMYVLHAMENIRYSDNFFPRLDFETLLKILTVDTLALVNPALAQHISRPITAPSEEQMDERYDRSGFWDNVKNQRKIYSTRSVTNKTLINPRKATDSIIEISIRCAELEGPRLSALLDFFVRHFIKIAERCHQYRAYRQKIIYLDQADRLSILLSEHPRHKEDARAYRDKIKALRRRNANSRLPDDPPETPRRNMEAPIFVAPLKDRFTRESLEQIAPSERGKQKPIRHSDKTDQVSKTSKAVVHEVRFQNVDSIKVINGNAMNNGTSSSVSERVISIVDDADEFCNESTHI